MAASFSRITWIIRVIIHSRLVPQFRFWAYSRRSVTITIFLVSIKYKISGTKPRFSRRKSSGNVKLSTRLNIILLIDRYTPPTHIDGIVLTSSVSLTDQLTSPFFTPQSAKMLKCFVTFRGLGSGLDDWFYWHLIHTARNYRQCSTIAILHTLQFTVTHALGSSVFTSRILATDL
jgi:hypothetical protein